MDKRVCKGIIFFLFIILVQVTFPNDARGIGSSPLILDTTTEKVDVYQVLYMLEDNEREFTIEEVMSEEFSEKFIHSDNVQQRGGFFETHTWLRFEIHNQSEQRDWFLEFAFPQIFELQIYEEESQEKLHHVGSQFPFRQREINHRHFVFSFELDQGETKVFYALASGGGDLHPPISIWEPESFIEKSQVEFALLGLFYGVILVMILYNLFLYFSLRLRSYLYYVIVITFTLLGKMSINGVAFQYFWPYSPEWNIISTPVWVSLACIFILIFTRTFLDVDQYIPRFKFISNFLIGLNGVVIVTIFLSYYIALNLMLLATLITFFTVLSTAFICLLRGARQARFFIIGWFIFLIGVFITIIERAAIVPFSVFTEYAGQGALTIEVVLLSFALADKINIMRTEKEQAEKTARESQTLALENLKKADELKDEFLAITSHELRTPLFGMIGIAESLRDGVQDKVSENMKNQLSMIITSGNRLTHLVNDILDFSKLKHESIVLERKPVHLNGVVDVVFAICKPLLKSKEIQLVQHIDPSLQTVHADPNRLQQILYNLIENAIKYTNEGNIVISAVNEGNFVKISVADTGRGMSKEQQSVIFEPFQQLDKSVSRDAGGVGLGLTITKRLVDLHAGRMEVNSKLGVGTTFSVMLPIHRNHTEVVEEVALSLDMYTEKELLLHETENTLNRGPKILIADDEPINLQVLTNHLTLEGYEIITAFNGEEVLNLVENHSIDLLILDIMMPKMSGYEVCQRLRKKYSLMELPVLMLTAKNQLHDKIASFEVGANDYLVKPCDKQELLSRVKTLVQIRTLNQELKEVNMNLEEKVQERTEALDVAIEELKQMNESLQDMVESRRRLLSNIAHELGTPVTLIYGYLQALQEGVIQGDDQHYRQRVFDKIKILNRLIDDLSDLSQIEGGKSSLNLKEVGINQWVDQVFEKFIFEVTQGGRSIEKVGITENFKGFLSYVDVERMDQVFSNLISNAIKNTTKDTGVISVYAYLNVERNKIIIEVKDNGFGISNDSLPFIFERFYKELPSYKVGKQNGTGLGLAIVKEIVQGHKGDIWAKSKINEGSEFYISLPVHYKE
ncbi:ATP-binding protein [Evansella sp. AB-P1]|uniref:ATP-binding protein n=1 Tax=Evansella sp. AB-P1 TaxID=3037653 RepID=UPI00241F13E5|nr:ATP-binding protein [Evansella sp. AB-P1]MDG5789870.1 ATP-binding protein [Evansella sp. AB-P1]